MKLLVDTCTFLWLAGNSPRLTARVRAAFVNPGNSVYLSSLSVWEIAIKYRLGRLPLPDLPGRYVVRQREELQIEPLVFDEACAGHEALLPSYHTDPFDRGLVSQAILNGMILVTPDPEIARYPAPVLW